MTSLIIFFFCLFFLSIHLVLSSHSNAHEASKNQLIQAMRHVLGLHAQRGSDGASDQTDEDTPHSQLLQEDQEHTAIYLLSNFIKMKPGEKKKQKKQKEGK